MLPSLFERSTAAMSEPSARFRVLIDCALNSW
jgi:hypothetical protein